MFVTEDGTISGWNPMVNSNAVIVKNRAGKAVYKGCAIAQVSSGPRFYATNFQSGRVEVFDSSFHRLCSDDDDAFRYPGLDDNWSPFNIQHVGGNLVVTFAHRAPGSHDEDHGAGLGFVGVYDLRATCYFACSTDPGSTRPGASLPRRAISASSRIGC